MEGLMDGLVGGLIDGLIVDNNSPSKALRYPNNKPIYKNYENTRHTYKDNNIRDNHYHRGAHTALLTRRPGRQLDMR